MIDLKELFSFEKIGRELLLSKVSNKIGLSEKEIISYLENNGFNDLDAPIVYLNDAHIDVLSKAYVQSIKSFYTSVSRRYSNLSPKKQRELKIFFSRYVKKGFGIFNFYRNETAIERAIEGKLNNSLILEYYYDLIQEVEYEDLVKLSFLDYGRSRTVELSEESLYDVEYKELFNKFRHRFKLKIKIPLRNIFNDIRSKLQSILICNHYYIFSDDDDNNGEVNYIVRFSRFINIPREALKLNYNLKFQERWMKTLKFS